MTVNGSGLALMGRWVEPRAAGPFNHKSVHYTINNSIVLYTFFGLMTYLRWKYRLPSGHKHGHYGEPHPHGRLLWQKRLQTPSKSMWGVGFGCGGCVCVGVGKRAQSRSARSSSASTDTI